jgi:hypothetical protein
VHGARAGLLAGVALGVVEIAASSILRGDLWLPFDFAAALIVGPEALLPAFPVAASLALGTVLHVLLSIVFGMAFLGGLALTFQLSARPSLMVLYGLVFTALCTARSSRRTSSGCVLACSTSGGALTGKRHDATGTAY